MVTRTEIERFARELGETFRPVRVVLFGSHARGKTREWSDVDLMVVMEHRGNELDLAVKMLGVVEHRFPIDLLVWRPAHLLRRYKSLCPIAHDVMEKGVVLYEARRSGMGRESKS